MAAGGKGQIPGSAASTGAADLIDERPYSADEQKLLRLIDRHFAGREVICPKCRAGIGMPCVDGRGAPRTYATKRGVIKVGSHAERIALAEMMAQSL